MLHKKLYWERRQKLKSRVGSGIILLCGNERSPIEIFAHTYYFRQDSSFLYYSGINSVPSLFLLIDIDNNKEILFGDNISLEDQIWTGAMPTLESLAENVGIHDVQRTALLSNYLNKALKIKRAIHYLPVCRSELMIKLSLLLGIPPHQINDNASKNLISAVISQREIKSAEEVVEIEKALNISADIYDLLLKEIKPGISERELLAQCESIVTSRGHIVAFPTILTKKCSILHNWSSAANSEILKENDLLLVDSGVLSQAGYASDITRTYPAGNQFTNQQKDIYTIVLDGQLKAIDEIKPDVLYKDIHLKVAETMANGLKDLGLMKGDIKQAVTMGAHALFFPHGLGHMLGMDVHDLEMLGEDNVGYDAEITRSQQFGLSFLRLAKRLKAGFVLTAEPGIYFIPELIDQWQTAGKYREFINYDEVEKYRHFEGIRIEDDLLVTETGCKVLGKPIPKSITEIENNRGI